MIDRLAEKLFQSHAPTTVSRRLPEHPQEVGAAEMEGTAGRHDGPSRGDQLHGAAIDLLVAAESGGEMGLRLGKGRWIDDHHVKLPSRSAPRRELIEGIPQDKLDVGDAVQSGMLCPAFQGLGTHIERHDLACALGEVEGEGAVIAEAVEGRSPVRYQRTREHSVVALVEEGAGLLAGVRCGVPADSPLPDLHDLGDYPRDDLDLFGKTFQSTGCDIVPKEDPARAIDLPECGEDLLASRFQRRRENLNHQGVVVAVDDQRGKGIPFAVDFAPGRGVDPDSSRCRLSEVLRPPLLVDCPFAGFEEPKPDFGAWGAERLSEKATAAVLHGDDTGSRGMGEDVATIDPGMSSLPAGDRAGIDDGRGHGRPLESCGQRRSERDMGENVAAMLRLLLVTDDRWVSTRTLLPACEAAIRGGVTAVQLRLKEVADAELLLLARSLVRTLPVPVFVNDRLDVALASGAAGVHLGADDIPPTLARRVVPPGFLIGASVGNPEEAERGRGADYWGIGPLRNTRTKSDAGEALGWEGAVRLRELGGGQPTVVIGGVEARDVPEARANRFAGVAVVSGILGKPDIEAAARAFLLPPSWRTDQDRP